MDCILSILPRLGMALTTQGCRLIGSRGGNPYPPWPPTGTCQICFDLNGNGQILHVAVVHLTDLAVIGVKSRSTSFWYSSTRMLSAVFGS